MTALLSRTDKRSWHGRLLGMPVLLFLAAASWLCGAQEYRSSDRDKAQVLDFLKRVLNAVDQDPFLEPERLRSVLGIELLEWAGDENVSPFHRNARRIVTNVSVLDDTDIANRLRYSIVPREGRYVFWIDRMAHVTCVSPREVVAALGEPNVLYGHTHGRTD